MTDLTQILNGSSKKPAGTSYSLYVGDLHIAHINFDEFISEEQAEQLVAKALNDGITARKNDGSSKATKQAQLAKLLAS